MADNRSRREKLEAVLAPNSGATQGEKDNARAILKRMGAEPKPAAKGTTIHWGWGHSTSSSGDFMHVRSATFTRPVRQYDAATEELIRRASEQMSRMSLQDLLKWMHENMGGFDNPGQVNQTQAQLCKRIGHDWIVLAKTVYQTDVKRCARCGEYDPPRKPKVTFETEED